MLSKTGLIVLVLEMAGDMCIHFTYRLVKYTQIRKLLLTAGSSKSTEESVFCFSDTGYTCQPVLKRRDACEREPGWNENCMMKSLFVKQLIEADQC